jgi:hypothetical protein
MSALPRKLRAHAIDVGVAHSIGYATWRRSDTVISEAECAAGIAIDQALHHHCGDDLAWDCGVQSAED